MDVFSVYILRSLKNGKLYFGYSSDVAERLKRHNKGLERYSRSGVPWEVIHTEEYSAKSEAIKREKYLKSLKNPRYVLEKVVGSFSGGGAAR